MGNQKMTPQKLLAFVLIFLLGCARNTNPPRQGSVAHSPGAQKENRELELGNQIHQTIVSSFRVYTEPRLVGYVTRIGRSLAQNADRQDLTYRFTVLYDDRIYATGAPGGFVYITTGFLNFLRNEAELAAVLAHEIGELQFRDPRLSGFQQARKAVTSVAAVVGSFLGPIGVLGATGLVLLDAFAESRTFTPEEKVLAADRKAFQYLIQAHQDPQGFLDLLGRLMNLRSDWAPYSYDYLSARPLTLERFQEAMDAFETLPLAGKSLTVHRDRYLEMTKGVREIYQR